MPPKVPVPFSHGPTGLAQNPIKRELQEWEKGLRANNPITKPLDSDLIINLTDWHFADSWELAAEKLGEDPNKIRNKYRWKPSKAAKNKKVAVVENRDLQNASKDGPKKKIILDRYGKLVTIDASEDTELVDTPVSAEIISDAGDTTSEADNADLEDEEEEEYTDRYDETFKIIGFGLTSKGESVTIQLEGFKPYFFIKVPDNWGPTKIDEMIEHVKKSFLKNPKTAKFAYAISAWKLIQAKPFRDFTGSDLFNFVRLTFNDKESWSQWSNSFRRPIRLWSYNGGEANTYALYESNIVPLIRFLHIQEISPSGWIRIKKEHFQQLQPTNPLKLTRAQLEIIANYKNVVPYELPETAAAITPMIIASTDIEADSSHGDFPIAKKDYQKLAQDLINESGRLYADKESIMHKEAAKVVLYWLKAAFNKYHGPYNINTVSLESLDPKNALDIKKVIDELIDDSLLEFFHNYYHLHKQVEKKESHDDEDHRSNAEGKDVDEERILEQMRQMQTELADHFIQSFPEARKVPNVRPNSSKQVLDDKKKKPVKSSKSSQLAKESEDVELINAYEILAIQVLAEYTKNRSSNNIIWLKEPRECLIYLIRLAFDGIWNAHSINRVYTLSNPDVAIIEKTVPDVVRVLKNCHDFLLTKEQKRKQKKKSKPAGKKAAVKTEKEKELENRNRNYYVEDLTKVLNARFAKYQVIGDTVIQIGTTFQRYGEKHPYLKHIIVLNSCESIKNEDIISHEHKDITFPVKELISFLSSIRKDIKKNGDLTGLSTQSMQLKSYLLGLPENEEFDKTIKKVYKEDPQLSKALNNLVLEVNRAQQLSEDNSIVVVESYTSEAEVLLAWTSLIQKSDPDIITGYNIFGFDFDFMYQRSQVLGIADKFGELGRIRGVQHKLFTQELSSSGLGENILKYIPMYGRVLIDMFKVVQANYKLPIYKLDYVCKHFLYKSKNDLPPKEIFIQQKGTAADRRKIAEYCLIDCILVNRLINKLEIITNQIGMSNVCMVPLSYLFLRGQGVKILSLVSMYCRKEGFLIPVLKKPDETEESFEGAIVLPPQNAIFFEPVAVSDFNSLYPSCIIAENLCHTSHTLKGGKYDNLPGYNYVDIVYDRYKYEPIPGKKKLRKVKCGIETCRYVQLPDGQKSLLPRIEQNLLAARAKTRSEQKAFGKDSFQWKVKEGLQLAYKVTANSLYGQVGAKTSAIYYKNIAACTTATGRRLIYFTKTYFEANYDGAVTVYGDSVTGDTPILLQDFRTGEIIIKPIASLHAGFWMPYEQFKSEDNVSRWNKEQNISSYKVWSANGWTPIKRVIRHRTTKAIYRVTTNTGSVDVTEDHSLLDMDKKLIKPTDLKDGLQLLYGYPVLSHSHTENKCLGGIDDLINDYGKLEAAKMYLENRKHGYNCRFTDSRASHTSHTSETSHTLQTLFDENPNIVKKVELLYPQYDDFVYDLETEEGNFQAGIGQIIVKNTDSVFEKFKCVDVWGDHSRV